MGMASTRLRIDVLERGREIEPPTAVRPQHEVMRNQLRLLAHRLIVQVVCRPFEEPVEHHRHDNRGDHQRDHVQENDPREDRLERNHAALSSEMRYPTPRMVWICTLAPRSDSCLRSRWM